VVVGLLLLACVVVGVGSFCRYIKDKQGDGGRVGSLCGAVCRACLSAGFPDWHRPIFNGFFGDIIDTDTESDTESDSNTETDRTTGLDAESQTESDTDAEMETESETGIPVWVGDRPVEVRDMSYSDRGSTYISNASDRKPDALGLLKAMEGRVTGRTVLIVSSHPYDTYRDGGSVSALAEVLAEALRAQGVMAVYVPVEGEGTSYVDTYRDVMEIVRYQEVILPDVGLIIDLRRSGELTEQSNVLQTDGRWAGGRCAQLRLTVDGDGAYWESSLGAALWLRQALWNMEPTLCRPVALRQGAGLAAAVHGHVAVLTAEVGSLGNSYAEACCAIPFLAQAVADFCVIRK
jgi:hypothetical protein